MSEINARQIKAKQMRYKRPILKDLNLDRIKEELYEIQEACEEVRWYTDSADGTDSLINALSGGEDEAYEFKMAFADLCAECERMVYDLEDEIIPECFDIFFVAVGSGNVLGYDSFEDDYYGLYPYEEEAARDEARKKLKTMTKDQLIEAAKMCFGIFQAYVGLRNRYDSLEAAIAILRDQNAGILQAVREIDRIYTEAQAKKELADWREFDRYTAALPQEAWIA